MPVTSPRNSYTAQTPQIPLEFGRTTEELREQVRKLTEWVRHLQSNVLAGLIWYKGAPAQLINAAYDPIADEFNRLDTTKVAWLIEYGTTRDIPGETNLKGITFWQAVAGTNPIGSFTAADGWLGNFGITSDGTLWTRGTGLEIDRNGSAPFVRVQGYIDGSSNRYFGLASNWFNDLSGVDDNSEESWFIGLINDDFVIKRAAAGETTFGTNNPSIFQVTNAGTAVVAGPLGAASYTVSGLPAASSWANHHVYVTDETGGYVMAFSDGTNWRRVTDRAVVS